MDVFVCGHRAARHGRQKSPLFFFLSAVLAQLDGDADCFSMTAAVWALGWTVCNAPLQCLEGNTIWPHAHPPQSFEINAVCSTIYYPTTIRAGESSVWNHTQGGITCWHSAEELQSTILAQAAFTQSFILSSVYFDYNYASSLWFSYKHFAYSVLEKGHASLLLSYYYYYTTTSPTV